MSPLLSFDGQQIASSSTSFYQYFIFMDLRNFSVCLDFLKAFSTLISAFICPLSKTKVNLFFHMLQKMENSEARGVREAASRSPSLPWARRSCRWKCHRGQCVPRSSTCKSWAQEMRSTSCAFILRCLRACCLLATEDLKVTKRKKMNKTQLLGSLWSPEGGMGEQLFHTA